MRNPLASRVGARDGERRELFLAGDEGFLYCQSADPRRLDGCSRLGGVLNLTEEGLNGAPDARLLWRRSVNALTGDGLLPWWKHYDHSRLSELQQLEWESGRSASQVVSAGTDRVFVTDGWGVFPLYLVVDDGFVAVSNHALWLAVLADSDWDDRAIWEALFFPGPLEASWFKGVERLGAGSVIRLDCRTGACDRTRAPSPSDRFSPPSGVLSLEAETGSYFDQVRRLTGNRTVSLALSAGTDSRTVLGCLLASGCRVHSYTFAFVGLAESDEVRTLVGGLGIPASFICVDGLEEDFEALALRSVRETDGLLKLSRLHYLRLYDSLPRNHAHLEGIFGSEFVKGELAAGGAMVGAAHAASIRRGTPVDRALAEVYPQLPGDYVQLIAEHVRSRFERYLPSFSATGGLDAGSRYVLDHVPSVSFSPTIALAQNGHQLLLPFLSQRLLSALFSAGLGVVNRHSLQPTFDGLRSLRAEGLMLRSMKSPLYSSVLYNSLSYRDAMVLPDLPLRVLIRLRQAIKRAYPNNLGKRSGQTDLLKLQTKARALASEVASTTRLPPVKIDDKTTFRLVDLIVSLYFLGRVKDDLSAQLTA